MVAKIGLDTAENEPCKVCPLSAYRSPRCDFDTEEECWSTPPDECWTNTDPDSPPVDEAGNPLNCESQMTCHSKSVGCPVYCGDGEVAESGRRPSRAAS